MKSSQKLTLIAIILFGFITPFLSWFVIIEFFFLIIPFVILFFTGISLLIFSTVTKWMNFKKTLFYSLIIPIFISSQLLSSFIVDNIQKYRSELIIKDIERIEQTIGVFPDKYKIKFGINYNKIENEHNYRIDYLKGFMIREVYYHKNNEWVSRGWHD